MNKNVYWIQNISTSDVTMGDLNLTVRMGRTIDIYRINPSLTPEKVEQSLASGSLFKRFRSGVLRPVTGPVDARPPNLDHLKTAQGTIVARKTKTSVIIDPNQPESEDGSPQKGFDFADYGVSDTAAPIKGDHGSVVLNAKQDDIATPPPVSLTSKQIIDDLRKKSSNPMGQLARINMPSKTPFVVVDNRTDPTPESPEAPVAPPGKATPSTPQDALPTPQTMTKTNNGMVIVGGEEPARSIKAVAKGTQDTETIPDDDVVGADKVIKGLKDDEGMRIATKTKEGAVIMKTADEPAKKAVKKKT